MTQRDIDSFLTERRRRVEDAWRVTGGTVVLIGAGYPIPIPGGADQHFEFRSHPEYFWLTDNERAGSVLAYDPDSGWQLFVPPVTELERVWEGLAGPLPGEPLDRLESWLDARKKRPLAVLGGEIRGVRGDDELASRLRTLLTHARRRKDDLELSRIRRAVEATAAGHACAAKIIAPGLTERELEIELEAAFFRAGAERVAYETIVGSGPNSAVFHFTPSQRRIGAQEIVLIDAGAEVHRYAADVTRVFPAVEFTGPQRELYDLLLSVQVRAVERCRPGLEWRDAHHAAACDIAEGLAALDILRGPAEELTESGAVALFFPHGVGHMVGLGVRDAGGALPDRTELPRVCGVTIRADLPLESGYVMTVEPGIYFIPALLDDPERRKRFAGAVNWGALDRWRSVGGMRIEDNVLVTEAAPEVLTSSIPK